MAQLKDQYAQVGDRLESEQTRIMQARLRAAEQVQRILLSICVLLCPG